jgi:hypothetical protein
VSDDDAALPPGPGDPHDPDGVTPAGEAHVAAEPTDVAVITVPTPTAVQWRQRALTVRAAVPQLARNPVVVGASAAVATVALRLAAEAAARALGASAPSRPRSVAVTGSILHAVHVVRHVRVVHHVVHHYPSGPHQPWSRWSPP